MLLCWRRPTLWHKLMSLAGFSLAAHAETSFWTLHFVETPWLLMLSFCNVSVLLTSASSAFFKTFFFDCALGLVGLQRLSRLGTRLPPPCNKPRTRLAQKDEDETIYNHIRKPNPKSHECQFLSISISVLLPDSAFCLLLPLRLPLSFLSHQA